MPTFIIG